MLEVSERFRKDMANLKRRITRSKLASLGLFETLILRGLKNWR
jgi:hypothetical protein